MNPWNKFRRETPSFGTKIFYLFALLILIFSISFSSFFIYSQSRILKKNLIEKGQSMSRMLAFSSRLGVFAENEDMIQGPLEGARQNKETILVQVFAFDNKQMKSLVKYEKGKTEFPREQERAYKTMLETFQRTRDVLYFEGDDKIEFWAPVISDREYSEDDLYFGKTVSGMNHKIIGFVRVILTTNVLKKALKDVLARSILIPLFFLIPGGILVYIVVKGITRPLIKLTKEVKALESGREFERISAETGDEIGRLASAFNDMAESLKKREREKEELEEQLRHSQKMEAIGTLSGGIAHDFNNILSVIKSYGQLLQKKTAKEDDANRYLGHILSSADKASTLTRSLLAIGRRQIINPSPVNLSRIIRNVEGILRRLLEESILLEVELPDDTLIVTADSGCLELVLINLATNARDAMPAGGSLKISLRTGGGNGQKARQTASRKTDRYAIISVADTGSGIDEAIRSRIFDPFFTTKEVGKGTGLGLSMAYGIIDQHGGRIDVDSEPGRGSTFHIYLPVSDETLIEPETETQPEPEGGTETILLAEDNDDMRSLLKIVLQRHGYRVIEAVNGKDVVDKFTRNGRKVDLLLLDVMMPERNGKEAYEEIRKLKRDVKVLFMSGYSADALHNGACNAGKEMLREDGPNFLSKPVAPDELLRKMREILDAPGYKIQK